MHAEVEATVRLFTRDSPFTDIRLLVLLSLFNLYLQSPCFCFYVL